MKQAVVIALLIVALQCVSLCSHNQAQSSTLTLKFSFCPRDNIRYESLSFYVGWNGATVFDYTPEDYEIHHVTIKVQARVGENTLNFAGTGVSDARGTTIDNVRLLRECGCGFEDLVVNGEFHEGVWVDRSWRYFYEGIIGWTGKELEIGNGRLYNKRLPQNNPVTELDAARNVDIVQTIYLDESFRKVAHYIGTPSVVA